MRIKSLALIFIGVWSVFVNIYADECSRDLEGQLACTSIMVGRKASADGSVMTSHTCDGNYRSWMRWVLATDNPSDTTMTIYSGRMHTETPQSMEGVKAMGRIPQVAHTYRFLDTAYPCLNEKRLAMGETTIGGRKELKSDKGLFYIEELQRVALQRCSSARQAIRLMGELIAKYGYVDSGECLTIADTSEVWIFEVFGEGAKKKGGVWAAQRIPDDEIAVSANVCRIGEIDIRDTLNFMASENVFDVARKRKLWDEKEPFSFWRAYSGVNYLDEKKNYSTREYFIMRSLAPSLHLSDDVEELPVSVKPDHPVRLQDVDRLLSTYYEGTEDDYTSYLLVSDKNKKDSITGEMEKKVSPRANPWMRGDERDLYAEMGDSVFKRWIRPVAVSVCSYSTIIQLFSDFPEAVGAVAWIALDNPGESPRFPVYCGSTELPNLLKVCGNHSYREDSAMWRYRRTNRLATVRWGDCRKTLEPAKQYFIDKGQRETVYVTCVYNELTKQGKTREAVEYLNGYTSDFLGAEILKWDELYTTYWKRFWTGF
ncbi:MAG: dipeptidase [Bacteroidaceae bacterium]